METAVYSRKLHEEIEDLTNEVEENTEVTGTNSNVVTYAYIYVRIGEFEMSVPLNSNSNPGTVFAAIERMRGA